MEIKEAARLIYEARFAIGQTLTDLSARLDLPIERVTVEIVDASRLSVPHATIIGPIHIHVRL